MSNKLTHRAVEKSLNGMKELLGWKQGCSMAGKR